MNAEISEGKLYVLPESVAELKALAQFGADTSPETLADQLVLPVPHSMEPTGTATTPPPQGTATTPPPQGTATTVAPPAETPEVDERDALVTRCEELGIEVKSGVRTTTLKKLIAAAEKEAAKPAEPEAPKAEAPAEKTTVSNVTQKDLLKICKGHISCFKEPSFQKVLNEFGAEKLSDITEDRYVDFIDALTEEAKELRGEKEKEECPEDNLLS